MARTQRSRGRGRAIGLAHRDKAIRRSAKAQPVAEQSSLPQESSNGAATNGEAVNHLKTYECHGVVFTRQDDHEHKAECPFCGKKAFSVNDVEGLFRCWDCGKSGNKYTFLQSLYDFWYESTNASHYKALSKLRNLPSDAFAHAELAWDRKLKRWLIPIRNATLGMVNLRHWKPDGGIDGKKPFLMNTAGCKSHLYNLDRFIKDAPGVCICEGEWDVMALEYMLTKAGVKDVSVVGVPGADTFKEEWASQFNNKVVYLLFDNDEAGQRGMEKAAGILRKHTKCKELHQIAWPESYAEKFDIRDYVGKVSGGKDDYKRAWDDLKKLLKDMPLHDKQSAGLVRTKFEEVVKDYEQHIYLSEDMKDALVLIFAVIFSNRILDDPYCPLWLFIVGPPGGGKTLLLQSMGDSELTHYESSLSAHQLVSRARTPDGSDPSLLPDLIGKTLIMKDWTELMSAPGGDQDLIFSTLRGVYDGRVDTGSGLGIRRVYPAPGSDHATCHFTILAGVTNQIHIASNVSLGERFIKYQMVQDGEDTSLQVRSAVKNTVAALIPEHELRASATAFIEGKDKPKTPPAVPKWVEEAVISLSQIVAVIRAVVHRKQGELSVRPSAELGTRLSKQLIRLGQCIAFTLDRKEIDKDCYRLMQRVGLDTCYGWHRDVILALAKFGRKGALRDDIMLAARVGSSTAHRSLEDLFELGAVTFESTSKEPSEPRKGRGQPPKRWFLTEPMQKLLDEAKFDLVMADRLPKRGKGKKPARADLHTVPSPRKESGRRSSSSKSSTRSNSRGKVERQVARRRKSR